MFEIIDKRPVKLKDGMIIHEYIDDKFTRKFIFIQHQEPVVDHKDKHVKWVIEGEIESTYAYEILREQGFVK